MSRLFFKVPRLPSMMRLGIPVGFASLLALTSCGVGPLEESVDGDRLGGKAGEKLYGSHCSACHLYNGRGGLEGPPLDQSSWVRGPEERIIKIVLHGVRGPVEVLGETYDREMPGFGEILSNQEVAALLSFVRIRFGSSSAAIAPETVEHIRDQHSGRTAYWSIEELLAE